MPRDPSTRKSIRVLVCGGRTFDDTKEGYPIRDWLYRLSQKHESVTVIHGYASGADSWAGFYAKEMGLKRCGFRAQWDKYGKAAGPKRNQRMLDEGKPDLVLAFSGGRGTADMVRRAQKAGVTVIKVVS